MFKKIFCFGILFIMVFSLAACNQDNDLEASKPDNYLEAYKIDASTTLEIYAESKGQDSYTEDNWMSIERFVTEGKMELLMATDKVGVDSALTAAIQQIDAILKGCEDMEYKDINNNLFQYNIAARAALDTYAQEKGKDYYTPEDWKIIYGFVEEGKKELFEVKDKAGVDSVITATKQRIDTVISKGCDDTEYKDLEPGFYTLQEAYDLGAIKKNDLLSIAYYRAKRFGNESIMDESFVPTPKNPEVLGAETVEQIKKDWIDWRISTGVALTAPKYGVQIDAYYGIYNDCVVVVMGYVNGVYPAVVIQEYIGGVKFCGNTQRIEIWKK